MRRSKALMFVVRTEVGFYLGQRGKTTDEIAWTSHRINMYPVFDKT